MGRRFLTYFWYFCLPYLVGGLLEDIGTNVEQMTSKVGSDKLPHHQLHYQASTVMGGIFKSKLLTRFLIRPTIELPGST